MLKRNNVVGIIVNVKDLELVRTAIFKNINVKTVDAYIKDGDNKALIMFKSKTSRKKVARIIRKKIYKAETKIEYGTIFVDVNMA